MEIHYIRNLMTSYMVLEQTPDWREMAAWEHEMIAHSKIPGVIFAEKVRENDNGQLWYDISGKQSLDTVLDAPVLSYKLLCIILAGIYEAVENLESFLLQADSLLLRPECIFLDSAEEQIYFCYGPKSEKAVTETFSELMEYLLTRLDHTEEKSLELAYQLYEQSTKEGFCLSKLQSMLCIDYEKEPKQEENREMPEEEDSSPKVVHEKEKEPVKYKESGEIIQKIAKVKEYMTKKIEKWKIRFCSSTTDKHGQEDQKFVFEPEEPEIKPSRPTVLISQIAKAPEGILLYEGSGNCNDLKIEGDSYTIGSDDTCEGCIPSSTVSRKHARITRNEDIYFLEDLNSTNGTFIGGELLNYHVKMSLEKNEIIMFADERFRFI